MDRGLTAYLNINLLSSCGSRFVQLAVGEKHKSMGYVLMRWYIYLWQCVCGSRVGYYVRRGQFAVGVVEVLGGAQLWAWQNMRLFLRERRLAQRVMMLLVIGLVRRDMAFVLECIRKIMLSVRLVSHRRFIFVVQLFIAQIFRLVGGYCGLRGYRIEVVGKFGRGGLRRTRRYILAAGERCASSGWVYSYSYKPIRLVSGVMGVSGFFRY